MDNLGIDYGLNNRKNSLPFSSGIAMQEYHCAEDGIIAASNNNCTHWYIDGSLPTDSIDTWTGQRIENIKEMIGIYRVQPIFHGNFKVPLASDVEQLRRAAIEYTKAEIDISHKLSASLIIHGGGIVEPRLVKQAKRKALANYLLSVSELAEYAMDKNVTLHLENLSDYQNYRPFHYIFTHMEEFDFVFNAISRFNNVDFFLDIGHANICGGEPVKVIKKYHKIIKGLSFSNNDGLRDLHLGIKNGIIDYDEIINAIIKCNWTGIVVFETRGRSVEQSISDVKSILKY